MECLKYVKSYLAFTYLPTFPRLSMQRSNRNPSRPLQRLQIRQGQSTLRGNNSHGNHAIAHHRLDAHAAPPHKLTLVVRGAQPYGSLVHAGYPYSVLRLSCLIVYWHGQCTPVTPHPFRTVAAFAIPPACDIGGAGLTTDVGVTT